MGSSKTTTQEETLTESLISNQTFDLKDDLTPDNESNVKQLVKTGTVNKTVFTLMAAAMGTGMFNLPLRNQQIGIFSFLLFLSACCAGCYFGSCMISYVYQKLKVQSYTEMVVKLHGKGLSKLGQMALIMFPLGNTISYVVIIPKFVVQLLYDVFDAPVYLDRETQEYTDSGIFKFDKMYRKYYKNRDVFGRDIVEYLLHFKKGNRISTKAGNVRCSFHHDECSHYSFHFNNRYDQLYCLGFEKIVEGSRIPYHGIFHLELQRMNISWFNLSSLRDFSKQLQGCASILFVFINIQLIVPSINNLPKPTHQQCKSIFRRVACNMYVAYTVMGLSAYLLLAEHADKCPIQAMAVASIQTAFISFGKVFLICALFIAIPLNLNPCRQIFFETFQIDADDPKKYILTTLGLLTTICVIGITFQQVNSYFGLIGGFMGSTMGLLIPSACYFKLKKQENGLEKSDYAKIGLMTTVALFAVTGGVLSIADPV